MPSMMPSTVLFPGAVVTEQADDLLLLHLEAHVIQRGPGADEAFAEIFDGDHQEVGAQTTNHEARPVILKF